MPDALSSVGIPCRATAVASTSVGTLRLSRSSCLRAPLHGRSPMPAPPRLITASTASNVPSSMRPAGGSQPRSSGAAGARRTSRRTSWPACRRSATRAVPIRPDEPATTTRTGQIFSEPGPSRESGPGWVRTPPAPTRGGLQAQVGLEGAFLEPGLDRAHEPAGVGAVDDPVVVGERQVADRADGDHVVPVGAGDHRGLLGDLAGAEDGDLRLVDDR